MLKSIIRIMLYSYCYILKNRRNRKNSVLEISGFCKNDIRGALALFDLSSMLINSLVIIHFAKFAIDSDLVEFLV